ncbi:glycosyltransferase [Chitinilyticum piscinae]|uniref:Glycosyltransferase family 2 protein n=1 Tax=Chitinilyticum piscinae TaxID=2866724 RepID=A0A8J7FKS2_9NEIS|nr:glycosyltransferase family A protein [Chitinilyticum piscinae]MBE9609567.1 glycosyltransferase family 2 protein [Chitinilyticum piscinae]
MTTPPCLDWRPAMLAECLEDKIAVVVIGHNEGERLSRCLRSVWASDWPAEKLDVIYVDSASTDDSCFRARSEGARVFASTQPGAAAARNTGWRVSHAQWIMFLDGDTVLDPHFLRNALKILQKDESCACIWGHRRELAPHQSCYVRVLDLDWCYQSGDTLFCGGDALFRRSALLDAGGYDATIMAGEEPELCYRLRCNGWRIRHINAAMTLHDLAISSFSQYWQRAVRAGYAYAAVSRHTGALWQSEVRHSLRQAGLLLLVPLLSLVLLTWGSAALLPWLALCLLMLRSAWRARWRSQDTVTLLLYGIHSWFEQLPVCCGIWRCWHDQRQRVGQRLINYKRSPS